MLIAYRILINQKQDPEGRNISMCDGYTAGDPLVQAWNGNNLYTMSHSDENICDELFEEFNIDHPKGYRNRSLSKGDVIVIQWPHNDPKAFAVESFGFKAIDVPADKDVTNAVSR